MSRMQTSSAAITPLGLETKPLPQSTSSLGSTRQSGTQQLDSAEIHNSQLYQARKEKGNNPLYQTSNASYGSKPLKDVHKPTEYFGSSHSFSKEFVGGMFRNQSLNTNRTRNIAMPDPSFGANHFHDQ
ncbi:predicted protein [Naegleria gruberi]|uniref:Predicted protein n=1 Tax=Naegleria gruberi TaxID=5762 RepID=D2VK29_NAEGR|nr:uncharacterized protein NAEGRDRAFT_69249 [Naegleria gruberi]EFC42877.1 predicted protein [Naegleria gruberi]|eukprot:XP_002675621.1 predicted protein [Naegleria gruberi strain NEG-M]